MDLSYWTKYNPEIQVELVKKLYFDTHAYRVVYYAPGGRAIYRSDDIDHMLGQRRIWAQMEAAQGFGALYWNRHIKDAVTHQLERLRELKKQGVKMRVEEPHVQIYAATESELRQITDDLGYVDRIRTISVPGGNERLEQLRNGILFTNQAEKFGYKILLRDGRYSQEMVRGLVTFFDNHPAECVPLASLRNNLTRARRDYYIYNGTVYCTDERLATMLNLIAPGIVRKIYKLEPIQ